MEKAKGGRPAENPLQAVRGFEDEPPTYAEMDIIKRDAHNWQTIAAMPEEVFERHVAEVKVAKETLWKGENIMQIKRGTCPNCSKPYIVHAYEPDVSLSAVEAENQEKVRKALAKAARAIYLDLAVDTQVVCPHCRGLLLAKM